MSKGLWPLIYLSFVVFWVGIFFFAPAWLLVGYLVTFGFCILMVAYFLLRILHARMVKSYIIDRDEHGNLGYDTRTDRDLNLPPKGASEFQEKLYLINLLTNAIGSGSIPREWAMVFASSFTGQQPAMPVSPQGNSAVTTYLPLPEVEDGPIIDAIVERFGNESSGV